MINRGGSLVRFLTRFLIDFGSILEGLGGVLGVIWGALRGHLGVLLGCVSQQSLQGEPESRFGRMWDPFWRDFDSFWTSFSRVWVTLRADLESIWESFRVSWVSLTGSLGLVFNFIISTRFPFTCQERFLFLSFFCFLLVSDAP